MLEFPIRVQRLAWISLYWDSADKPGFQYSFVDCIEKFDHGQLFIAKVDSHWVYFLQRHSIWQRLFFAYQYFHYIKLINYIDYWGKLKPWLIFECLWQMLQKTCTDLKILFTKKKLFFIFCFLGTFWSTVISTKVKRI